MDTHEHIFPLAIFPCIKRFIKWLFDQEEVLMAVIGHSSFFREMSGSEADHCNISKLDLSKEGNWYEG